MRIRPFSPGWIIFSNEYSKADFGLPEYYKDRRINSAYSIAHSENLKLLAVNHAEATLVFIGDGIDINDGSLALKHICSELLLRYFAERDITKNMAFLNRLDAICGRYALFIVEDSGLLALNDVSGLRPIYYHTKYNIAASHYGLVNTYARESAHPVNRGEIHSEYLKKRISYPHCLPADITPYKNILMLVPNYYLRMPSHRVVRFFPRADIEMADIYGTADYLAESLKTVMKRVNADYSPLMSLTAGFDSRITLSACKEIKDGMRFFTYFYNLDDRKSYQGIDSHRNIMFVRDMAKRLGLRHHEIDLKRYTPSAAEIEVFCRNNYVAHGRAIPLGLLENNLVDERTIHVRSNVYEPIRRSYFNAPSRFDKLQLAQMMAYWGGFNKNTRTYAAILKLWLDYIDRYDIEKAFQYGYNYGDLFYLEYRMAQWMGGVLIENDVACDTFVPINARKMIIAGLSVAKEFKDRNALAALIIEKNWPELLSDYRYPNNASPINMLADYNAAKYKGYIPLYDDFTRKYNFQITSGNSNKNDKNNIHFIEVKNESVIFGTSKNIMEKGDFIDINFTFGPQKLNNYYYLSFDIINYYNAYSYGYNIFYEIYLKNVQYYRLQVGKFARPNQIVYIYRATDDDELELKISLKCERTDRPLEHNTIMKIDNILFREEALYRRKKNYFMSTEIMLRKLSAN